jgi:hypothetical protein
VTGAGQQTAVCKCVVVSIGLPSGITCEARGRAG